MKPWLKNFLNIGCIIILSVIALGFFIYRYYQPDQYFKNKDIPIISSQKVSDTIPAPNKLQNDFNILILGIDARKQEKSRTDVMMVANVNPNNKQINIISIPRDTRVEIPGTGYTKINHAHLLGEIKGGNTLGTKYSIEAVSNLLQCKINYYIKVNFEGFEHFIDSIGGVEIELNQPVTLTYKKTTLPAGKQTLNGHLALKLVRERHSLPNGDFGRQKNQFLVLEALVCKMVDPENISKIPQLVKLLKDDVIDTNLTDSDTISLALLFKGLSSENIKYTQISGKDAFEFDPLVNTKLHYMIPDQDNLRKICKEFNFHL